MHLIMKYGAENIKDLLSHSIISNLSIYINTYIEI